MIFDFLEKKTYKVTVRCPKCKRVVVKKARNRIDIKCRTCKTIIFRGADEKDNPDPDRDIRSRVYLSRLSAVSTDTGTPSTGGTSGN